MEESMNSTIVTNETPTRKVNVKQVSIFVALTFVLSWSLDLVLYLKGGLSSPVASVALQLQMLLPAFSAMLLESFFFKDSRIYFKTNRTTSRWFIWYFLLFTLFFMTIVGIGFFKPFWVVSISSYLLIPSILGLVLLIVLRLVGGKESFNSVGMGGGKAKYWILIGIGIAVFAGLQTLLNWVFKMGQPADQSLLSVQAAMMGVPYSVLMIILAAQTIILGPFLGLIITFGEEYGWRGFLQPALTRIGRKFDVLLVGIIWGIWHWPIIWMGYNFPGHPYLGSLLMLLYCIGLAFILGYAVLKSKGVWIAAFLHALANQSFAFFMGFVYLPKDTAFSFGIGIPGLITLAIIVLLILRDPVWKESD